VDLGGGGGEGRAACEVDDDDPCGGAEETEAIEEGDDSVDRIGGVGVGIGVEVDVEVEVTVELAGELAVEVEEGAEPAPVEVLAVCALTNQLPVAAMPMAATMAKVRIRPVRFDDLVEEEAPSSRGSETVVMATVADGDEGEVGALLAGGAATTSCVHGSTDGAFSSEVAPAWSFELFSYV
jgi:hypothetical protein